MLRETVESKVCMQKSRKAIRQGPKGIRGGDEEDARRCEDEGGTTCLTVLCHRFPILLGGCHFGALLFSPQSLSSFNGASRRDILIPSLLRILYNCFNFQRVQKILHATA